MSDFLDQLARRVLVFDGAMGTQIQAREAELDLERDFLGHEGCNEVLCLTRPELIERIHTEFLAAGADAVETNSFGSGAIVLAEYGLADRLEELNRAAARIARAACDKFAAEQQAGPSPSGGASTGPGLPLTPSPSPARGEGRKFVVGAMGPGTKLPSLGHTDFDTLAESYRRQSTALLEGGADVLLIETCQDILQAKAAVAGAADAIGGAGRRVPLMVQLTMEATGAMLVGTDLAAALAILDPFEQIDVIGLNCATGPAEMSEHVRHLGRHSHRPISVQPNAGLPQMVAGRAHYPLTPAEFARWAGQFVRDDGVAIVGGCCGTTPEHIRAVVKGLSPFSSEKKGTVPLPAVGEPQASNAERGVKKGDSPLFSNGEKRGQSPASVASLYSAVELHQEPAPLIVGERANANGSKKFRELLEAEDLDGMVALARGQANEGAHVIDLCAAFVGRDERADMGRLVARLAAECPLPLMIDSTETAVIAAALKRIGGRAIVNSINLEDGERRMEQVCPLARRYGAAVVALTIDEEGMAKSADRKVAVARRIFDLATRKFGLRPQDLLFDALTFTLGSGDAEFRNAGVETLDAIRRIKAELPGVFTLLGVSNISFGLSPAARHVINSVFLHYAIEAGLDAAIVHAGKIMPLAKIEPAHRELARRLVFNERTADSDPLTELIEAFRDAAKRPAGRTAKAAPASVEQRITQRIVDGDRTGLEADLDAAMAKYPPLEIINRFLLDGMKVVGEQFASGEMQLPFVLNSAETMKAAVRRLEPHMEKAGGGGRGRIVLATVKGDVHDIGKNLVDIILTNNGYEVTNLGIKQPIGAILAAAREREADAIGLSGLLVKSTLVMREDLEEMNRQGVAPPVLLGGAALTRKYVEEDLRAVYRGRVFYGRDAFAGLRIMDALMAEKRGESPAGAAETASAPTATGKKRPEKIEQRKLQQARALVAQGRDVEEDAATEPGPEGPGREVRREDASSATAARPAASAAGAIKPLDPDQVPTPPFWGARVVEQIPLASVLSYVNPVMLFQVQWQFRRAGRSGEQFEQYLAREVRPIYRRLVEQCEREEILQPRAVYGYWPAAGDGDDLVLFDPADPTRELARFTFPRQRREPCLCISDFFLPADAVRRDVVAFQVVTMGGRISAVEREWFAADRYQDYFFLHGLGVEAAEAAAEFLHKQVRVELGIAGDDARDVAKLFQQGYRGSRYSFGYPACPDLADQAKLWPLLEPGRIGVTLSDEFQLDPEQSTSALIVHHPKARYFNVR